MATDFSHLIGQHRLCLAQELCNEKGKWNQTLSERHFLYRWWFPDDSPIMAFVRNNFHEDCINNKLKQISLNNQTYYALYFGKTTNGRNRFRQHTEGPIKDSTLRETIRAILALQGGGKCSEDAISEILRPCYFEWMELVMDANLTDCVEAMAITVGNYPLNIDGNLSVCNEWKKMIMDKRHELKGYK